MKIPVLIMGVACCILSATSQAQKDTVLCTGLPRVQTPSTINQFTFSDSLQIPADSLKKGFKIITACAACRVAGFRISTDCEGCEIIETDIPGDHLGPDSKNWTFISWYLNKGTTLYFECINLAAGGKKYLGKPFEVRLE